MIARGITLALAAMTSVDVAPSTTAPTIQPAVDAAMGPTTIRLAGGAYRERVHVGRGRPAIALVGVGDVTVSSDLNAGRVVGPSTQPVGTFGSATLTVEANDFAMTHVTIENAAGDVGQAVAFLTTGDRGVYRDCRFVGWQDTLCVDAGRHLFDRCAVEGRVDFIFGGGVAWFERCVVRSKRGGYVTAARTPATQPFGFVFDACRFIGDVTPTYLGRPWQWDRGRVASVTLLRCVLGPHVRTAGWHPWRDANVEPAKTTRYAEFESVDADGRLADVSRRVAWSRQLEARQAAAITRDAVLGGGDEWWP